jgi:glycosyltransferase involved in cell wall biosynthesis
MVVNGARPLRVLMVMHLRAMMELGGARVQLELAEVLRERGCDVRILDRPEILGPRLGRRFRGSQAAFTTAAVRAVRAIAHEYDVIDAHQGNLPVTKARLGFDGLIVARSVGLAPFYADFERAAHRRWPASRKGSLATRPLHAWRGWRFQRAVATTFRLSDLIIVPNSDERAYLAQRRGLGEKIEVLPLGISQRELQELGAENQRPPEGHRVAFIGDWNARKGSHDWREIAARVLAAVPDASFSFLGTSARADEVRDAVGLADGVVDVVPSYRPEELGRLIEGVRVGALPSYVEGMGIGVLEKMAAGIPSVCYDVPGPRDTVGRVDRRLLVPAGDTEGFAQRLVELLRLDEGAYVRLSERCRAVAEQFSWRLIGERTLRAYHERLAALAETGDR